jgi:hypothetical protein
MNIKGVGRAKKSISVILGRMQKKRFEKFISSGAYANGIKKLQVNSIEISLVTYSNSLNFTDFLLSIISFLKAAGKPLKWTLYTDDLFSNEQFAILSEIEFISLKHWDADIDENLRSQYGKKWQLRKFIAFANYSFHGTTIYLDSDVIFYPTFMQYFQAIKVGNWYLPEPSEANNIDDDLEHLFDYRKVMYTVNSGFLIANKIPDWGKGMEYIQYCSDTNRNHYFLDQTAFNLMFYHDTQPMILDPRVFHISTNDHFKIFALPINDFAIRHYVGLIRHKMWQLGWRSFFNND